MDSFDIHDMAKLKALIQAGDIQRADFVLCHLKDGKSPDVLRHVLDKCEYWDCPVHGQAAAVLPCCEYAKGY